MAEKVNLIDRGRGMQLPNNRITVLDLVPYFQRRCPLEEINYWFPTLTTQEITAVQRFYADHQAEYDEKDKQARAYREEQIRQQRLRFPETNGTTEERVARIKRILESRQNGERNPGR